MLKDTSSEHPSQNGEFAYVNGHGFRLYEDSEKGLREPDTGVVFSEKTATTTSLVDEPMPDLSIIPDAGEYLVIFSGDLGHSDLGVIYTSIYVGHDPQKGSIRQTQMSRNGASFCSCAKVTVNGAQSVEGWWRVSTGTGTNYNRQLLLIKVAEKGLSIKLPMMMKMEF
jgi:hypothetical protein